MPDVQSEDKRSVLVWVKRIGDLRDGLLVGASLLYGLGYVVWSLNAWDAIQSAVGPFFRP
jgi:hypothetical protein